MWFQKSQNPFTILSVQPNLSLLTSHYTKSHTNDLQPSINCEGQSAVQMSFSMGNQALPSLGMFRLTQGTDFSMGFSESRSAD